MPDGDSASEGKFNERVHLGEESVASNPTEATPVEVDPELLASMETTKQLMRERKFALNEQVEFAPAHVPAQIENQPLSQEDKNLLVELELVYEEIVKLKEVMVEDQSPENRMRMRGLVENARSLMEKIEKQGV